MRTVYTESQGSLFPDAVKQSATQAKKSAQIWAVGSGKGGVGKTLIAANTAITLARAGAKVIAIDLDLGGANLHTCLGVKIDGQPTLTDFIDKKVNSLDEVANQTAVENLTVISGAHDAVNVANLAHAQKQKLISRIKQLPADYVILDLGAGTTFNTLDFFLSANLGILTILPEPTSVENAYRFIKSAFYRNLKHVEKNLGARNIINSVLERKEELAIKTPAELLRQIELIYPDTGYRIREEICNFELKFVLNQVRTQSDAEIGWGIRNISKKYFGLNLDFLGYLEHDNAVWQAVRKRRPLALEFPNSPIMPKIQRFVTTIISEQNERMKRKHREIPQ